MENDEKLKEDILNHVKNTKLEIEKTIKYKNNFKSFLFLRISQVRKNLTLFVLKFLKIKI